MKRWEEPKIINLGVEKTEVDDGSVLAPPWQNCGCVDHGNGNPDAGNGNSGHTHGTQPNFCPCCAADAKPSLS